MKCGYDKMTTAEIMELYIDVFDDNYRMSWNANPENWVGGIIECIESGKPQDMSDDKYPWNHPAPEGCIE